MAAINLSSSDYLNQPIDFPCDVVAVDGQVDPDGYEGIELYNQGTENVDVNGRIIPPYQAYILNGFPGQPIQTVFVYTFAGGGTPSLAITKKTYA